MKYCFEHSPEVTHLAMAGNIDGTQYNMRTFLLSFLFATFFPAILINNDDFVAAGETTSSSREQRRQTEDDGG